ncbi:putative glycoside hydrolase family 61 protein [Phaeoacremonium minimum UCRPA7]|uniref:lytic cellulose monooxygenase (C4-dehydrogenating) n=1 Tax=Phaeoacremonium minimum (strain UCR-PA7) TaxID=1286976 RepID=R8B8Z7_PHAM7|nr:putative glycoside hydrolase family 61 protein [Phaeoacremonium minimum UCRPA7]EON95758.1 putative glycoside hydrolase family 61 protein [Phaeoacremonium minimum UCRPA7]
MKSITAIGLLSLLPLVASHGAVTSYTIGGTAYPGYDGFAPSTSPKTIQRQWSDYNPTMTVTDSKMRCNGGTSASMTASIKAGENITANYKQWTHQQGPVMVWMFKCAGEFAGCDGSGKGWFKIDQMGMWGGQLNSNNWGTAMVYKNLKWSSKIPSNLTPGNYLIRHELLALHQANTPQFYAECAQLAVTGSGSTLPSADYLYSIPGYAPQSDPGITVSSPETYKSHGYVSLLPLQVDVYSSKATTYTCPGGNIFPGFT